MRNWSKGSKDSSSDKNWQGKRGKKARPSVSEPAWQASQKPRTQGGLSSSRSWQGKWRLYTLLGAILLGVFLYLLLLSPEKTPVLLITGIRYESPIPPNAWALEDSDTLKELTDTLLTVEIAGEWGDEGNARKEFRRKLKEHSSLRRGLRTIREPVLIYLSLPGLVNRAGQPCLLPPRSSPWSEDDWVTVDSIVRDVASAIPGERPKLLILDSNQILVNWRMGIIYNTFVERLSKYIDECDVPNLAVLTAADAGQMSWTSPQLGGTAFGQFLQLGLAGEADLRSQNPDGEVSVIELSSYVRSEVDRWTQSNRGSRQQPLLMLTRGASDFLVTHALSESSITEFRSQLAQSKAARSKPSVDLKSMAEIWNQLDRLQARKIVQTAPVSLGQYWNRSLRMQCLAYGGMAYINDAKREAKALSKELERLLNAKSLPHVLGERLVSSDLHSLPLREYFGKSDQGEIQSIEQILMQLTGVVRDVRGAAPIRDDILQQTVSLEEAQFLAAAHQQGVVSTIDNSKSILSDVLALRNRSERLAVPAANYGGVGDERSHYYVRRELNRADEQRRQAEDSLFVTSTSPNFSTMKISATNRSYDEIEKKQNQDR